MRLARRSARAGDGIPGTILGAVLVLGGALAAAWLRSGLPLPVCRFREWTGLPCATCGTTRMIEALLQGRVLEAAAWNPLVFCVVLWIGSWSALSLSRVALGVPVWRLLVEPRERRALGLLVIAAVAVDWAYLIWRGV